MPPLTGHCVEGGARDLLSGGGGEKGGACSAPLCWEGEKCMQKTGKAIQNFFGGAFPFFPRLQPPIANFPLADSPFAKPPPSLQSPPPQFANSMLANYNPPTPGRQWAPGAPLRTARLKSPKGGEGKTRPGGLSPQPAPGSART